MVLGENIVVAQITIKAKNIGGNSGTSVTPAMDLQIRQLFQPILDRENAEHSCLSIEGRHYRDGFTFIVSINAKFDWAENPIIASEERRKKRKHAGESAKGKMESREECALDQALSILATKFDLMVKTKKSQRVSPRKSASQTMMQEAHTYHFPSLERPTRSPAIDLTYWP